MLTVPENIYSHSKTAWESIKTKLENSTNDNTPFMLMPVRLETRFMKVYRREYLVDLHVNVQLVSESILQLNDVVNNITVSSLTSYSNAFNFTKEISSTLDLQHQKLVKVSKATAEEKFLITEDLKELSTSTESALTKIVNGGTYTRAQNDELQGRLQTIQSEISGMTASFQAIPVDDRKEAPSGSLMRSAYNSPRPFNVRANVSQNVLKEELWIRIFPDDIFIHTHEEDLTADEIEAGKLYWEQWRASAGNVTKLKGAWKTICEHYDPERSAWIIKKMQPTNFPQAPSGGGGTIVYISDYISSSSSLFQNAANTNLFTADNFSQTAGSLNSLVASTISQMRTSNVVVPEEDQDSIGELHTEFKNIVTKLKDKVEVLSGHDVRFDDKTFYKADPRKPGDVDNPVVYLEQMNGYLAEFRVVKTELDGKGEVIPRVAGDKLHGDLKATIDALSGFNDILDSSAINQDYIQESSRRIAEVQGQITYNNELIKRFERDPDQTPESKAFGARFGAHIRDFNETLQSGMIQLRRLRQHINVRFVDLQAFEIQNHHELVLGPIESLTSSINALVSEVGNNPPINWSPFHDLPEGNWTFPTYTPKDGSWTQPAKSHVLPDRFVAIGLNSSNEVAQFTYQDDYGNDVNEDENGYMTESYSFEQVEVGKLIPSTLQVGPDPGAFSTDLYQQLSNGDLQVEEGIKWMVDFNEAVDKGMGIIMELENGFEYESSTPPVEGGEIPDNTVFDKLLVLGLKLDKDRFHVPTEGGDPLLAKHSKKLLEELLNNHHYTGEGMSFLEIGTSTNNTSKGDSGLKSDKRNYEDSFAYEVDNDYLAYTVNANAYRFKKDGQRMAEALGIDFDVFNHVQNAGLRQISDGHMFNEALWNGTLGHYFQEMLSGIVTRDSYERLHHFFKEFVSARGALPSLRVGTQPYGILPTSSFTNWKHGFESELDQLLKDPYDLYANKVHWDTLYTYSNMLPDMREKRFQYQFKGFLDILMDRWYFLQDKYVKHIDKTGINGSETAQQKFIEILGLQATAADIIAQFPLVKSYLFGDNDDDDLLEDGITSLFPSTNDAKVHDFKGRIRRHILEGVYPEASLAFRNESLAGSIQYLDKTSPITGPTVDRKKLSKILSINNSETDNYIKWIKDTSLSNVWLKHWSQIPNTSGSAPLLYKLLRQSYLMAHLDAFTDTVVTSGIMTDANMYHHHNNAGIYEIPGTAILSGPGALSSISHSNSKWAYLFENTDNLLSSDNDFVLDFMQGMQGTGLNLSDTRFADMVETYNSPFWSISNGVHNRRKLRKIKTVLNKMRTWSTEKLDGHLREHLDLCSYRLDAWMSGLVNKRLKEQRIVSNNERAEGIYLGAYGWVENVKPGKQRTALAENELPTVFQGLESDIFTDDDNLGYVHTPSLNHAMTAAILRSGYMSNKLGDSALSNVDNMLAVNLSSERIRMAMHLWEGIKNGQPLSALLGFQFERNLKDRYNFNPHESIYTLRRKFPLESLVNITSQDLPADNETVHHAVVNGIEILSRLRNNSSVQSLFDTNPSYSLYDVLKPTPIQPISPLFSSVLGLSVTNEDEAIGLAREIDLMANAIDALGDLAVAEGVFQVSKGNYDRSNATVDALTESTNLQDPEFIKTPRTGIHVNHKFVVNVDTNITLTAGAETPKSKLAPMVNQWIGEQMPGMSHVKVAVKFASLDGTAVLTEQITMAELGLKPIDLFMMLSGGEEALLGKIAYHVRSTSTLYSGTGVPHDVELEVLIHSRQSAWTTEDFSIGELIPLVEDLKQVLETLKPMSKLDLERPDQLINPDSTTSSNTTGWDFSELATRVTAAQGDLSLAITNLTGTLTNTQLRSGLEAAAMFNLPSAMPESGIDSTDTDVNTEITANLNEQRNHALTYLEKLQTELTAILAEISTGGSNLTDQAKWNKYKACAKLLFGKSFVLLPKCDISEVEYEISDVDGTSTPTTETLPSYLTTISSDLTENFTSGLDNGAKWMFGLARVREKLSAYESLQSLSSCFTSIFESGSTNLVNYSGLGIVQFPYYNDDEWYGWEFTSAYSPSGNKTSVVFTNANLIETSSSVNYKVAGFILDEWTETIPEKEETSGVTFNYDQPSTKPPQNILLAVSPDLTGEWKWDDLVATLLDTLKMSKIRAVEPDHIQKDNSDTDDNKLGKYLPTVFSMMEPRIPRIHVDEHFNNTQLVENLEMTQGFNMNTLFTDSPE